MIATSHLQQGIGPFELVLWVSLRGCSCTGWRLWQNMAGCIAPDRSTLTPNLSQVSLGCCCNLWKVWSPCRGWFWSPYRWWSAGTLFCNLFRLACKKLSTLVPNSLSTALHRRCWLLKQGTYSNPALWLATFELFASHRQRSMPFRFDRQCRNCS